MLAQASAGLVYRNVDTLVPVGLWTTSRSLTCWNSSGLALGSLAANDFEGDVYIPARRVRIGTNLGVGLLDELLEFLLR